MHCGPDWQSFGVVLSVHLSCLWQLSAVHAVCVLLHHQLSATGAITRRNEGNRHAWQQSLVAVRR